MAAAARVPQPLHALVEDIGQGKLKCRLKNGALMCVPIQKGLDIGDNVVILFEKFSNHMEVLTMPEWDRHNDPTPIPEAVEFEEEYSPTEDENCRGEGEAEFDLLDYEFDEEPW